MLFESELETRIRAEMERFKEILVNGGLDIRAYDRQVGGFHALRLVLEEFIPDVHKKLNES